MAQEEESRRGLLEERQSLMQQSEREQNLLDGGNSKYHYTIEDVYQLNYSVGVDDKESEQLDRIEYQDFPYTYHPQNDIFKALKK